MRRVWIALMGAMAIAWCAPSLGAEDDVAAQSRALERAANAVVGVQTVALEDARSNATLGRWRQGSGVVIGEDGLVLTIGYLIVEADQVQLMLDDGRALPARVVAYDLSSGFGLLMPLAPMTIAPVPIGRGVELPNDAPLLIASGAPDGMVSPARLVSRRSFAGSWEYRIDGALFTTPPRTDHSGAGLFNARGELVGIGSLVVADAAGSPGSRVPGNMFVPVDLLTPVLAELRVSGTSAASRRAWIGVNCVEWAGRLRVVRVSDEGPAEAAGLQAGDRIVAIDGKAVNTLDALWTTLWAGGPAEREVTIEIERQDEHQTVTLRSVDRQRHLRRSEGI
jgi:S1-C subfamily serine protease